MKQEGGHNDPARRVSILFVAHYMNLGGIERSLVTLMRTLPPERFDVYLQLTEVKGALLSEVPSHVHVSAIEPYRLNLEAVNRPLAALKSDLARLRLGKAFRSGAALVRSQLARSRGPYYDRFLADGPLPEEEFDIAVSYPGPSEMHDWYVARWVKARRKFAWIHFDIDYVFYRRATIEAAAKAFERIFIVDESSKEIFDRNFPTLAGKTAVFHNIIDSAEICARAAEFTPEPLPAGVKRIVTVGRVIRQKAQDIAVEVAAILKQKGFKFVWHIIGTGLDFDEYSRLPEKFGVTDCVRFEGAMLNPYPYLAAADVYVQPSRYEGYCISVGEARCFGMPIVATDFAGSGQLKGYPNHHITGHSAAEIADAVAESLGEPKSPVEMGSSPEVEAMIEYFTNPANKL